MNFTEQGKQALKWLIEGKEVECKYDEDPNSKPWFALTECSIGLFASDKHQFRIKKPTLKLVDMSKLPKGTMTNLGEVIGVHQSTPTVSVLRGLDTYIFHIQNLRIVEQTEFTYWGGGDRPVPEGLMVEVRHRYGGESTGVASLYRFGHLREEGDIIGYRITGLADGWTDYPSKAN